LLSCAVLVTPENKQLKMLSELDGFPTLSSCYNRQISNAVLFQEKKTKNKKQKKKRKKKDLRPGGAKEYDLIFLSHSLPKTKQPLAKCIMLPAPASSGSHSPCTTSLWLLQFPAHTTELPGEPSGDSCVCFFSSLLSQLKKPSMPAPLFHCPGSSRNTISTR